jgi:hypothetical protein
MFLPTQPRYGFTRLAEALNGRLAMVGFTLAIGLELLIGHPLLQRLCGQLTTG